MGSAEREFISGRPSERRATIKGGGERSCDERRQQFHAVHTSSPPPPPPIPPPFPLCPLSRTDHPVSRSIDRGCSAKEHGPLLH